LQSQLLADDQLAAPAQAASLHILEALDPGFAQAVSPGDFIVAGLGFAGDATRRAVPAALKALGIAAAIARSFGDLFVRQALNLGLPALVVEETAAIKTGDHLRVDVEAHIVANLSSGDRYVIRNLTDEAIALLRAGGAVARTPLGKP
jgi:3-isopropylmalate dehydratase small subunit